MEFGLLRDVLIIFTLSIIIIFIFNRLKIPSIIGFLITGVITGPHGLGLISNIHDVELLAEIGIVLLLFTIGIEFSIRSLLNAKRTVLLGGFLQVGLVIGFTAVIANTAGNQWNESLFIGFLIALSSTALVMKIIQNRGELGTFHGKTTVSILIFQDVIIVPMILVTPLLAGEAESSGQSLFLILIKIVGFFAITFLFAKFIIPKFLHQIALTQSRELFLLAIIVIGFAAALLSSSIGLSLALGAFIAGLVISESEYSEQAFGNVIPFRDLFISFFFVSVGMLLNIRFVFEHPVLVFLTAIGLMLLKTILAGLVAFILGYPFKSALIVGLALSQVGEFSFILSEFGIKYNLLSELNNQLFLSSAVITLSLTPFIINAAPKLAEIILKWPLPQKLRCGLRNYTEVEETKIEGHTVIVGFGVNGKNVAIASRHAGIPHVIIEMNPDTVREEFGKGEIIYYGDATQVAILNHVNIKSANVLVVTIPNPSDTRLIIQRAREINPHLHIIVRTRFIQDMQYYFDLGADEVIPEEFETSVEIFSRVLNKYMIPHEEIEKLIRKIRMDKYKMFRTLSLSDRAISGELTNQNIPEVHSIQLRNHSKLIGMTIKDYSPDFNDVIIIGLSRSGNLITRLNNDFIFKENDILFLLSTTMNFHRLLKQIQ
jgi:monovalent cation:H+ antiporter-2, CPA2 family